MEKSLKSTAINYGIYLGCGLVLYTVLCYVIDIEFLVNFWVNLLILPVVIIAVGVVSSAKARSLLGGFMNFKQAFTAYFIPIAIGVLISTIVTVILFNFIDPDSAEYLKELSINKTTSFMENMGAPQEQINEAVETMESQETFAIGTQLRSLAQSLIFFTVIGLLVALIMKKKDPNLA
ncbi:DUF4199 domain-containing protein [Psychroserpens luteus]|uniref:DUF4199 domain-containing protein n=1 Tax=Psychroserpens luteus TaxID=1434066 RepID=A0ABW5ZT35_9FLAO|nr:DUF4199 domain-containing protein [Psychroserpens luteus]